LVPELNSSKGLSEQFYIWPFIHSVKIKNNYCILDVMLTSVDKCHKFFYWSHMFPKIS
jgi:hypothetical protein